MYDKIKTQIKIHSREKKQHTTGVIKLQSAVNSYNIFINQFLSIQSFKNMGNIENRKNLEKTSKKRG